uniref:NADH-ubiquinone oxidoreductase chain 4 n=1 Tax=Endomyzostoma sp. MZ-2009 TaxID=644517 RepID=C7BG58_9ANNE|nr:NADH dehydrogenase subunit 4 [Endomyzostoma sp. MZ-2009]
MMKLILPMTISLTFFNMNMNIISLMTSLMIMFMSMMMYLPSMYWSNFLSNIFMLDLINLPLIMLSIWITIMMMITMTKMMNKYKNSMKLMWLMSLMLMFLMLCFLSMNLIMFYFLFESILMPIIMMIMIWGYQPERMNASLFMLMYTLIASLPLFMMILILSHTNKSNSFMMMNLMLNSMYSIMNNIMNHMMMLAFMMKMPMFLIHMWLPKAHVEAPVFGSMILAAILLKLGGYGMIRMFMLNQNMKISLIFISMSLWGAVLISIMCCRILDMKILIAYSSITHMGIMMSSLMNNFYSSMKASMIMMIAHGLTSSCLFVFSNYMYESTFSRNMLLNKGMLMLNPKMSLWWFLSIGVSMAMPPSLSIIAEMMLMMTIMKMSLMVMFSLFMLSLNTIIYSMIMFLLTSHSKFNNINNYYYMSSKNYMVISMHVIPCFMLSMMIYYYI